MAEPGSPDIALAILAGVVLPLGDFDDYPEDPARAARLRFDYGVALYTEAGRGPSWLLALNGLAFACALIIGIAVWLPGNAPIPWWAQALASAALIASTALLVLLYRRVRWAKLRLVCFRERYADTDPRWAPWVPLYLRRCAARLEREVAQADAVQVQAQTKYGLIVIGLVAAPVGGLFTLASFPNLWGGLAVAAGIGLAVWLYYLHRKLEQDWREAQAVHAALPAQSTGVAAEVAHCALLLYCSLAWGLALYARHFLYGYQPDADVMLVTGVWFALAVPALGWLWHLRRTAYWERVQAQLELQPTEQWRRIEFDASFRQAWLNTARNRLRLLWFAGWLLYVAAVAGVYMKFGIGQAYGALPLAHCSIAAGILLALVGGLGVAYARARGQAQVWQGQLLQGVRELRREQYNAALELGAAPLPAEHLLDRARSLAAALPALLLPLHLPLVQLSRYSAFTDVLLLLNLLASILALALWGLWLKRLRQVEWGH